MHSKLTRKTSQIEESVSKIQYMHKTLSLHWTENPISTKLTCNDKLTHRTPISELLQKPTKFQSKYKHKPPKHENNREHAIKHQNTHNRQLKAPKLENPKAKKRK